jgi:hypothetical protein
MAYEAYRSTLKLSATLCLICVFHLVAPNVVAADLQNGKDDRAAAARVSPADTPVPAENSATLTPSKTRTNSTQSGEQSSGSNSPQTGTSKPTSPAPNALAPLTPRQKFNYFARSSFMPPMPYALSVLSGVFSEATDKDHGRHMTAGDFMADSMTHAARSFAFRATANLFEKFAFASAFKQDPRYFRSDKKGFARIGYAVSRVVITRSDSGHDQFNASFFAGGLVAAGISNVWSRPEDRTVSATMGRYGTHVAYRALSNIVKELFGKR